MRDTQNRKLSAAEFVAKVFGVIMVVLYMTIGTTIIFKAHDFRSFPYHYAVIFGILLILYGFFRAYKLYRKYYGKPVDQE